VTGGENGLCSPAATRHSRHLQTTFTSTTLHGVWRSLAISMASGAALHAAPRHVLQSIRENEARTGPCYRSSVQDGWLGDCCRDCSPGSPACSTTSRTVAAPTRLLRGLGPPEVSDKVNCLGASAPMVGPIVGRRGFFSAARGYFRGLPLS